MKKLAVSLFGFLAFFVSSESAHASGKAFVKPVEVAYLHDVSQSGTQNGAFGIMSVMYNGSAGQSLSFMDDARISQSSNLKVSSAMVIRPALEDCNKDLKSVSFHAPSGLELFRAEAGAPAAGMQILQPGVYCEFALSLPVLSQSSSLGFSYTVRRLNAGTYYLLASYKDGSSRSMQFNIYNLQ